MPATDVNSSDVDMGLSDAQRLTDEFGVSVESAMNSRANLQKVGCDFQIEEVASGS